MKLHLPNFVLPVSADVQLLSISPPLGLQTSNTYFLRLLPVFSCYISVFYSSPSYSLHGIGGGKLRGKLAEFISSGRLQQKKSIYSELSTSTCSHKTHQNLMGKVLGKSSCISVKLPECCLRVMSLNHHPGGENDLINKLWLKHHLKITVLLKKCCCN